MTKQGLQGLPKARIQAELYQDEQRMKVSAQHVAPMDYVTEGRAMLDEIRQMKSGLDDLSAVAGAIRETKDSGNTPSRRPRPQAAPSRARRRTFAAKAPSQSSATRPRAPSCRAAASVTEAPTRDAQRGSASHSAASSAALDSRCLATSRHLPV